jgi:hypothetical protein
LSITNYFKKKDSSTRSLQAEGRPDLPPSPVPALPAFDKKFDGSRLIARFKLDSKDQEGNYTLHVLLALNSAPGSRFSSLTLSVQLTDGSILAVSPDTLSGPITEAEVSNDNSHQTTVNASLDAGNAPAVMSIGASTTFTQAEHIAYTRRTRGTIRGTGVGSRQAYWVMKEDSGPAAQDGLDPDFDLAVKMNVRPAVISYEIVVGICRGKGKEEVVRCRNLQTCV